MDLVVRTVIVFALILVVTRAVGRRELSHLRVRPLRGVLEGEPIVLLADGAPIRNNLRRERITVEELAAEARLQQIERLEDVRVAVLETNGRISFLPATGS